MRERYKRKSWSEIWEELRAAFRDPAVEAAELLSVPTDASAAVIKRRHRELALLQHPDKVCTSAPSLEEQPC